MSKAELKHVDVATYQGVLEQLVDQLKAEIERLTIARDKWRGTWSANLDELLLWKEAAVTLEGAFLSIVQAGYRPSAQDGLAVHDAREKISEARRLANNGESAEVKGWSLRAAFDRSEFDASPCAGCGLPVICLPDGLAPICNDCGPKREAQMKREGDS